MLKAFNYLCLLLLIAYICYLASLSGKEVATLKIIKDRMVCAPDEGGCYYLIYRGKK